MVQGLQRAAVAGRLRTPMMEDTCEVALNRDY